MATKNNHSELEQVKEKLVGSIDELSNFSIQGNNAVQRVVQIVSEARNSLLRDELAIGVTVLIGSLTIYKVQETLIKTPLIFNIGVLLLVAFIVLNLALRLLLIDFVTKAQRDLEVSNSEVRRHASKARLDPTSKAIAELTTVITAEPSETIKLKWWPANGHFIATALLVLGFTGIAASIFYKVG